MRIYPRMSDITPMVIPATNICLVFMSPVEYAIAFGGVLMGNDIANDAAMATPTSSVPIPPYSPRGPSMPLPTATMMGTISAVAAEFEMNCESNQQTNPPPMSTTIAGQLSNGIAWTRLSASPVFDMPSPSAKPPATIHRQAQSISFRSLDFIIRVIAKTPMGNRATTYELIPVTFSNIQSRIVAAVLLTIFFSFVDVFSSIKQNHKDSLY